ncbi:SPOR domain-containing protein [Rhodovulum adriaticum]|uniref:Sporulation related protein n=1 Tax=Rhodovulum adriaticum TaxID=35804 RepID=A0A4V2SM31_RHOAD|nr:SPOR domain-containing protein [Rhodovulum adriaticum]MBK1635957.1 hypothetical protein [Rhodovulum adriaticum]TCP25416.1 sporulation related protein [Rhodovulum adriaticum]
MADIDFDAVVDDDAEGVPPILGVLAMWAGGVMSLALVAGLATWGYRITVRDMTGVPVVQALAGPMRVAPDDPGGQLAAHQGLAVNHVAAAGGVAPPPDELQLAPRSVGLVAEDRTRGALVPPVRPAALAEDLPGIAAPTPLAFDAGGEIPSTKVPAGAEITAPETATVSVAMRELPEGALARSPRPIARPETDLVARAAIAAASAAVGPAPITDLVPEDIVPGTVLVQLGAFDTQADARQVWGRLTGSDRYGDFFDEKLRVVQEAESGGRLFYRLRAAGFGDLAEARRFCAALMAEGADCIPVVAR